MTDKIRRSFNKAIHGIFRYWAISIGCLSGLSLVSMWIPMFWVPFVGLCMALFLYHIQRIGNKAALPLCGRTVYIANLTLVWSSLIMIALYIIVKHTPWVTTAWLKGVPVNPEIPFIPILITGPVATIIAGWMLLKGRRHQFCRNCQIRHGDHIERGFIGQVFNQESSTQLWLIFWLSAMLSVGEYTYYIIEFITVNLSMPDTFFFGWVPAIVYVLSLIYLALRYSGLIAYYDREISGSVFARGHFSLVRFLIINGDNVFLSEPTPVSSAATLQDFKLDTPAVLTVPHHDRVTTWDAETYFRGETAVNAKIRFLYRTNTEDSGSNIFHFAAIIADHKDMESSRVKGQWVSMGVLQQLMLQGKVAPMLESEVVRIYTITMAWKSYDPRGFRLYDIKHYKPTFRLRDFPNWDVDYNDPNWLYVAENNEDRPFFRIRRLWRKYIGGAGS